MNRIYTIHSMWPILFVLCMYKPALPYALFSRENQPQFPTGIMYAHHDANEVFLTLKSSGQIGIYPYRNIWPKDTENNYIFGSGFWVGGIADVDGDGQEDQFAVQSVGYSLLSEFAPGRYTDDPDDPLSRLFVSTVPQDLMEWPDEFRDEYGDPLIHSLQDIVGIYNDKNGTPAYEVGSVGIQVKQRSMAFASGRTSQVIIVIWDMTNISGEMPEGPYTLEDAYIAIDSDMDIGDQFNDDRTSFFTYQVTEEADSIPIMMAYAWDEDFDESNFDGIPGLVGTKFLLSPGNDTDGVDNDGDGLVDESPYNGIDDDSDGDVDDWDEVDELGLVNYSLISTGTGGPLPGYPDSDLELYQIMSCDPPQECLETTDGSDVRFMMSSGPFDWPAGRTIRVAIAYVFALPVGEPSSIYVYGDPPRPDPNDPVFADFLAVALETQSFFDAEFPDTLTELLVYSTTRLSDTNDLTGPYDVYTTAVSSEGVSDVSLFYSMDGGATFLTKDMTRLYGNTYHSSLEGTGRGGGEMEYFVQAVDSSFRVQREPENAPAEAFDFRVLYIPDFLPPDSVSGIEPINFGTGSDLQWQDYDNDGDLDLYATTMNPTEANRLYRNDGERSFTDVSEEAGTGLLGEYSGEIAFGDYDNDGNVDIAVGSSLDHILLLRNSGDGTFEEVSQEAGLTDNENTRTPLWVDADVDGFIDLIATSPGSLYLYMNNNGSNFEEEAIGRGLISEGMGSLNVIAFDSDGDGDSEILLASNPSRFYRNDSGYFVDVTSQSGLGFEMDEVSPVDIDSDGYLDLFTTYGREILLLVNDGTGVFTDVSDEYGLSSIIPRDKLLPGDINADGLPDLILASGIYIMGADDAFRSTSDFNGIDRIDAVSDADSDGLLDVFSRGLYLSAGFPGGLENNWLELDLEGTLSNRSAIGAVATLFAGEKKSTGIVPGASPLPHRLHYGFEEETPDSLIIRWPSGIVQVERDLPVNAIITIEEDSTLVAVGGDVPSRKIPTTYALYQNYPNPFNPQTTIGFDLPDAGEKIAVRLSIYDVRGRLVRKLVDGELSPGQHRVIWDGRDDAGVSLGSGVYLYMIKTGDFTARRKLVLLR
ncbi:MAG: FG-GAP-like repeat-containing protein [Candidatus Glassbacteria bacterium]